jgi:hypothetical protein
MDAASACLSKDAFRIMSYLCMDAQACVSVSDMSLADSTMFVGNNTGKQLPWYGLLPSISRQRRDYNENLQPYRAT